MVSRPSRCATPVAALLSAGLFTACVGTLNEDPRIDGPEEELRLSGAEECIEYAQRCEQSLDACDGESSKKQSKTCARIERQCSRNLDRYCADVLGEDGGTTLDGDAGTLSSEDAGTPPDEDAGAGPDAGDGTVPGEDAGSDTGDVPPVDTFACLGSATDVQTVTGHHEDKYEPDTAAGRAFDARDADFLNAGVRWGMIHVEGDSDHTDMCWAGGYVMSDKPWDASWEDHKDRDGPTRNSTAINNGSVDLVVTGLHFFNVHDGHRSSRATNWLLQHSWGEYVRDDCIENDKLKSGRVYDTLFDGCYTGISTRPSSSNTESQGEGEVVELDRVLLRLQPMPYPYKWDEKSGVIDVDGDPYDGVGAPYGHGKLFKLEKDDIDRNPHFVIRNSVFLATHYTKDSKYNFPPPRLIDACENNTIIWLGGGDYPGELPTESFPDCFEILTGDEGRERWREVVTDWHARHPDVGADRKPASPGSLEFPTVF